MPNVENFGSHYTDIRSLTYPARHLDRFLITSLEKKEWMEITSGLQRSMTDQLIDNAMKQFPAEVIPLTGNKMGQKLKSRRDELPVAVEKYYSLLARSVNITGSDKAERFLINRDDNNQVSVTVIVNDNKPDSVIYHRTFYTNETKYINVYGLDGDDVFIITGKVRHSIVVRIFGGKGSDTITNLSETCGLKRVNRIYDYESGKQNSIQKGDNAMVRLSDDHEVVEFNRQIFHYNTYLPLPFIYYTAEDGLAFGLGLQYVFHHFGEDGYTAKLKISDRFSTKGNFQFKVSNEFHHLIRKWDVLLAVETGQPYAATYFYGAGNETVRNENVLRSFYLSRVYGYKTFTGLQKIFWQKSSFNLGINYESNTADVYLDNYDVNDKKVFGESTLDFFGASTGIDIDFRDDAIIPKHGIRLYAGQQYSHFNISDNLDFGKSEILLELYQTRRIFIPVTLTLKGGFTNITGDVPYYKLVTLGRTTGLRGYDRERFAGKTAARFNSQLSFEFGKIKNHFMPLTYGLFGFYDAGRVWLPKETSDKIHMGYGGGIFFTPLLELFTTRISVSFSDEAKKGIFEAGLGVGF